MTAISVSTMVRPTCKYGGRSKMISVTENMARPIMSAIFFLVKNIEK
jgi:hypothetical protein